MKFSSSKTYCFFLFNAGQTSGGVDHNVLLARRCIDNQFLNDFSFFGVIFGVIYVRMKDRILPVLCPFFCFSFPEIMIVRMMERGGGIEELQLHSIFA